MPLFKKKKQQKQNLIKAKNKPSKTQKTKYKKVKQKKDKHVLPKMVIPKTNNEIVGMFFKDVNKTLPIIQIIDDVYSVCLEYEDVSFAQADYEQSENIFLKWVDFLNSFSETVHLQVVNATTSVNTENYKQNYILKTEGYNPTVTKVANEFNNLIEESLGASDQTLITKRYLVYSLKAESYRSAWNVFQTLIAKTESKFKELKSNVSIVSNNDRLRFIYDNLNLQTMEQCGIDDIFKYAEDNDFTLQDAVATQKPNKINLAESDMVEIAQQKYLRCLYVSKLPNSMTPRFYNRLTNLTNINTIISLNIQPTNNAKSIKKIEKRLTGMKTERLDKVKRANKSGYDYSLVQDENLENSIRETYQFKEDLQKNGQKVFETNFLICVIADSFEKLEEDTQKIIDISAEYLIEIRPMKWEQLEGLQHIYPLGHNSIQFQRSLTSEATGINVPFNSKDLLQEQSIFFGKNLVSNTAIFADRKKLLNGNACVLATSGAGKSFCCKDAIMQIFIRYPEDDIIIIDPQREYQPIINSFEGQTIKLSASSDTVINPFDLDLNYGLSEDGKASPITSKVEYIIAFLQSIIGTTEMSGQQQSIITRCVREVYEDYELSGFKDSTKVPNLKLFYDTLAQQPEQEAKELKLILERYVTGSMEIFSGNTNVNIQNRFVCFDISELQESLQTTGYLVVLDHIMNRLSKNKSQGKYTWLFIDEFHILLENTFSSSYIAKLYKIGRKLGAMNTVITQNINDVLNNEYGRKILSNSEFALLLKQKLLDLEQLASIFGISNQESKYVIDSPAGQGLIVYADTVLPFRLKVPTNTEIYKLNETSMIAQSR